MSGRFDKLGAHVADFFWERESRWDGTSPGSVPTKSTPVDDLQTLEPAASRLEEVLEFAQVVLDLDPAALSRVGRRSEDEVHTSREAWIYRRDRAG